MNNLKSMDDNENNIIAQRNNFKLCLRKQKLNNIIAQTRRNMETNRNYNNEIDYNKSQNEDIIIKNMNDLSSELLCLDNVDEIINDIKIVNKNLENIPFLEVDIHISNDYLLNLWEIKKKFSNIELNYQINQIFIYLMNQVEFNFFQINQNFIYDLIWEINNSKFRELSYQSLVFVNNLLSYANRIKLECNKNILEKYFYHEIVLNKNNFILNLISYLNNRSLEITVFASIINNILKFNKYKDYLFAIESLLDIFFTNFNNFLITFFKTKSQNSLNYKEENKMIMDLLEQVIYLFDYDVSCSVIAKHFNLIKITISIIQYYTQSNDVDCISYCINNVMFIINDFNFNKIFVIFASKVLNDIFYFETTNNKFNNQLSEVKNFYSNLALLLKKVLLNSSIYDSDEINLVIVLINNYINLEQGSLLSKFVFDTDIIKLIKVFFKNNSKIHEETILNLVYLLNNMISFGLDLNVIIDKAKLGSYLIAENYIKFLFSISEFSLKPELLVLIFDSIIKIIKLCEINKFNLPEILVQQELSNDKIFKFSLSSNNELLEKVQLLGKIINEINQY